MPQSRRQFIATAALPLAGAAVALTIPSAVKAIDITPIQAAFARWAAQQDEICRISGAASDEEMEAALDLSWSLMREAVPLAAKTANDWALKTFMLMHGRYGALSDKAWAALDVPDERNVVSDMERAIYADAFRFVEPFAAA